MIRNLPSWSMVVGSLFALLLLSCTDEARNSGAQDKTPSFADCVAVHGESFYLFDGLDMRVAEDAIEGDAQKSREIVTELLRRGGDGASSSLSACQLIFWTELSAQNGDIHSAYELATIDSLDNGYGCRRSKHWARVVLSRIDEFRRDVLPDADVRLVERSIEGRKKQMEDALQRKCVGLQPKGDPK